MANTLAEQKRKLDKAKRDYEAAIEKIIKDLLAGRARMVKEHETALAQIDREISELSGTVPTKRKPGRKVRVGISKNILAEIAKHPKGIKTAEILLAMKAKGDKAAEKSVGNSLTRLEKTKAISRTNDGLYKAARK